MAAGGRYKAQRLAETAALKASRNKETETQRFLSMMCIIYKNSRMKLCKMLKLIFCRKKG